MKRLITVTAVLALVGVAALSGPAGAASSDPNDWATASVIGPPVGSPPGSYSAIWSVSPTGDWPSGWLLVALRFQPTGGSGTLSGLSATTVPAGWANALVNPEDAWLEFYANNISQQDMTNANGLTPAAAGAGTWTGQYTTTHDLNPFNYQLLFVNSDGGANPQGKWEVVRSSQETTPIPEPNTLALAGSGLVGLSAVLRRRKRSA